MRSFFALSARLTVMPEPGKTTTPVGRISSMRSLRLNGAALPSRVHSGLNAICACSDREVERFKDAGKPVYYAIDQLPHLIDYLVARAILSHKIKPKFQNAPWDALQGFEIVDTQKAEYLDQDRPVNRSEVIDKNLRGHWRPRQAVKARVPAEQFAGKTPFARQTIGVPVAVVLSRSICPPFSQECRERPGGS